LLISFSQLKNEDVAATIINGRNIINKQVSRCLFIWKKNVNN